MLRRDRDEQTSYVAPPLMPPGRDAPPTVLGEEEVWVESRHLTTTQPHTNICTLTHTLTCTYTNARMYTNIHACIHSHTLIHAHTYVHKYTLTIRMQMRIYTLMHTYTHTCIHTHTHAYTHSCRMILRNLCCQFLDCCYNSIMTYVLVSIR